MARHVRRRRRPTALRSAGALAALVMLAVQSASPAGGTVAATAPYAAAGATLTADAAQLSSLVYGGVVTVETTAGAVPAIELTSTSATLTGLHLDVACTPVPGLGVGMSSHTSTGSGSTSQAPDGLTIRATSVTATAGGASVTWTPQSPPPAADLGDTTLTDLTVTLAGLSVPTLRTPGLGQSTQLCTPA